MSREIVLRRVRNRLGVQAEDKTRQSVVEARLKSPRSNTIPQIKDSLVERFVTKATAKGVTVIRLSPDQSVATAIQEQLPPGAVVTLTESVLDQSLGFEPAQTIPWTKRTSLENCVSDCYCAIAETGSIVVRSDRGNTLTHNFLADRHFVLLPESDICGSMESVWQRVRGDGGFPRDLTLVSGPSSTGDIEMRMENGVHGPRELFVIVRGGQ